MCCSPGPPSKLNNRGAFGYYKKAHLEIIDGRMSAMDYKQLIEPLFPAWGFEMDGIGWQLQQDNAPIHITRSTLTYFKDRNLPLF